MPSDPRKSSYLPYEDNVTYANLPTGSRGQGFQPLFSTLSSNAVNIHTNMGNRRQDVIARSVTHSIVHSNEARPSLLARVPAFLWLYWLAFECVRRDLFKALRGIWRIDEDEYRASFGAQDRSQRTLVPMGTLSNG